MENTEDLYTGLIIRYLSSNVSDEEIQRLFLWINESKENEQLFFTLKDLFEASSWKTIKNEANTSNGWNKLSGQIQVKKNIKRINTKHVIAFMRYAAIFLLGVFVTYFVSESSNKDIFKTESHESPITRVVTGKGERTKVVLPDGTKVWVNACSSVSYNSNYGGRYRIVHLEGEAFFDVAKDSKKPFIVNSKGFNIKAHGTRFDVSAYNDDDKVAAILEEGSISFRQDNAEKQLLIKPGQKIAYSQKENEIKVDNVNTDTYTAWRTGEYRFEQLTFEEVAKRMSRIYNINFVFKNKETKKIPFTGTFFSYESLDKILKVININTSIRFIKEKDTVYIY